MSDLNLVCKLRHLLLDKWLTLETYTLGLHTLAYLGNTRTTYLFGSLRFPTQRHSRRHYSCLFRAYSRPACIHVLFSLALQQSLHMGPELISIIFLGICQMLIQLHYLLTAGGKVSTTAGPGTVTSHARCLVSSA